MNAQTVITHAPAQGITLSKVTDTLPGTHQGIEQATSDHGLSAFTSDLVGMNSLQGLRVAFATRVLMAQLAQFANPLPMVLTAPGEAYVDMSVQEIIGFFAQGFFVEYMIMER
jgi:hypothetical protein